MYVRELIVKPSPSVLQPYRPSIHLPSPTLKNLCRHNKQTRSGWISRARSRWPLSPPHLGRTSSGEKERDRDSQIDVQAEGSEGRGRGSSGVFNEE